jgi:ankyrin repeat protein
MHSRHKLDLLCSIVLNPDFDAENLEHDLLSIACLSGRCDVVLKVLEKAPSTAFFTSQGLTALHCAVMGGSKEVVKLILTNGVLSDDDLKSLLLGQWLPHQQTALHLAVLLGFADLASLIVHRAREIGVDLLEVRDAVGATPLLCACFSGAAVATKLLLQGGVNADAVDDEGQLWADDCGCKKIHRHCRFSAVRQAELGWRGECTRRLAVVDCVADGKSGRR